MIYKIIILTLKLHVQIKSLFPSGAFQISQFYFVVINFGNFNIYGFMLIKHKLCHENYLLTI